MNTLKNKGQTGVPLKIDGHQCSPLPANLYLNELDHVMVRQDKEMVRYADDFVILCTSEEEARQTLEQLKGWVEEAGLKLHPVKTRIVDATAKGGFDFLGYHFERGRRWPREKSLGKFRDTLRQKTSRRRPGPMSAIIQDVNRTMEGWFEYFKHSVAHVFEREDGWVRGRLRTILRKRHRLQGRSRGRDHQRWPNAHFADLGLFSMAIARAEASQLQR